MVEGRLGLEPKVQEVFRHIDARNNFLLSGGAGSGKTYSLVQVIRQIIAENPAIKIACMTYTNAAVREIEERITHKNLSVSTIHDFLWDNIKSFQVELKKSLIELINDEGVKDIESPDGTVDQNYFFEKEIQYKQYTQIREGIVSHDELLVLANYMFGAYSKLSDILKDKYKFIFIDEYQDASPLVVGIFLNHLKKSSKKQVIGFFGDAMQSIYDNVIGNLDLYLASKDVQEVKKEQNRRNPRLVYELANRLRTDGIQQIHSDDPKAPNMRGGVVIEGNIKFYYSDSNGDINTVKQMLGWDFSDPKRTKELNLTHNLIAPKAGFGKLMEIYDGDKILEYRDRVKKYIKDNSITEDFSALTFGQVIEKLLENKTTEQSQRPIRPTDGMKDFINQHSSLYEIAKNYSFEDFRKIYVDKDALLDDKKDDENDEAKTGSRRDNLIKHLVKIQMNVSLYEEGKFNEFLRNTEFKINCIEDKRKLRKIITNLKEMRNKKIEEVIEYAHEQGVCKKDDKLADFSLKKKYIYDRVVRLEYQEFKNLYDYLEGRTPFSTQHKIKGTEFDNVLVVLDNGNWSNYNFEYLMNQEIFSTLTTAKKTTFPRILGRTQKLFYVCCTRAKENLVVYYKNPTQAVLNTAINWFRRENVCEI